MFESLEARLSNLDLRFRNSIPSLVMKASDFPRGALGENRKICIDQ